jgi:VanZ family protein
MKFWIWHWGPAGIVMLLIFIASATPGSDLPGFGAWDLIAKKGGHMCGYALLASAFFHALDKKGTSARFRFFVAAGLACLYAATDEFHQSFTPGRSPSLQDVGIDALGAFIGLTVWTWIGKMRRNQHPTVNSDS